MKIALLGYGKMGRIIERIASDRGDEIVARVGQRKKGETLLIEQIAEADVCIDFSHPAVVIEHLKIAAGAGKPIIIGTTGWDHLMDEAKSIVNQSGIGCLYAPNFAIGVHLFKTVIEMASKLLAPFSDYDVSGFEAHHKHKGDSPSGTAKLLGNILLKNMPRKKSIEWERVDGPIPSNTIHFPSLRTGAIPGTHTVMFDSLFDTITITHTARGREGFAQGALDAADWIIDKNGYFTLDEMLQNISSNPETGVSYDD